MDSVGIHCAPGLMLLAWSIEVAFGWPKPLFDRIGHPVVWIGWLIALWDRWGNTSTWPHIVRYAAGVITTLIVIVTTIGTAIVLSVAFSSHALGFVIEAMFASSLLASRSLYAHVDNVAHPLAVGDLQAARNAVAQIVGRDPAALDHGGVARATIESLAENASDGVIAPLFWGVLFGLPGLAAYKAINTLDSMIGHQNDQYKAFGGFAARLDDVVNLIPSRLTGFLFASISLKPRATRVMFRDAHSHRSPNAGWPEAAMAGALGVRLSGPRIYGTAVAKEAWLNAGAPDPQAANIRGGLRLYVRSLMVLAVLLLTHTLWCMT